MTSPTFDDDLGLSQRVEDFTVEQLVAEPRLEALDVSVFPGASRCDVGRLRTNGRDPILHGLGHKLRAVVGSDVTVSRAE